MNNLVFPNMQPFKFWCQMALPTVLDDSLSYYEVLNKVVKNLNIINENMTDLAQSLVTPYDPNTVYAPGSYVWYNGKIYKCKNTTTGEWTIRNWDEKIFTDSLENDFNVLVSDVRNRLLDFNVLINTAIYSIACGYDPTHNYAVGDYATYVPDANEYDENETYYKGDYCIHDSYIYQCNGTTTGIWLNSKWDVAGVLYKCISATTGEFNPTKWSSRIIITELFDYAIAQWQNFLDNYYTTQGLVNSLGDSETDGITQKAATDAILSKAPLVNTFANNDLINSLHYMVNYGYNENEKRIADPENSASLRLGFERNLNEITLNLNDYYRRSIFAKINTLIETTVSEDIVSSNFEGISLETNHQYKLHTVYLSGTSEYAPNATSYDEAIAADKIENYAPALSVYEEGGPATTIGTSERISNSHCTRLFTAEENKKYVFSFFIRRFQYKFIDAKYMIYLEDLTEKQKPGKPIEDYYVNEMTETITKIKNEITEPSVVFMVGTDTHVGNSAWPYIFDKTAQNMKYFSDNIKCDFGVITGDLIEGDALKQTSMEYAKDSTDLIKMINSKYFFALGNHDCNRYMENAPTNNMFTFNEIFNTMLFATHDVTFNLNNYGTDFYYDNNECNTRIIILNSTYFLTGWTYGYSLSTKEWLEEVLNTTKNVIIFTHVSPVADHVAANVVSDKRSDITPLLNSFVNNGGKLILFTGHSHIDATFINPFVEITHAAERFAVTNINASYIEAITGEIDGIDAPSRTLNTSTEDLWSACVYKPFSNTISMIRFGAGSDKFIHCNEIAPTTVYTKLSDEVIWSSSDNSIATVNNGTITGVSNGKCAIIAKDQNNNKEIWIIKVQN